MNQPNTLFDRFNNQFRNYESWNIYQNIQQTNFRNCENTVSRKCEYEVLEITSDTKVSSHESKTSDLTRLLYHAWFPKPHTHISALTVLALLKNTNKWQETTNVLICDSKSQCSHMWVHWLLLDSLVFTSILQSM